ncbi:hypothetical protein [Actinomadura oligospora]|uniref:hypothetical protein n=1 Tax=Actinomadura oligospora TaxID=111804 RepID=UPI0004792388|nr:hypothetical protein [Actinomadura oligospora]
MSDHSSIEWTAMTSPTKPRLHLTYSGAMLRQMFAPVLPHLPTRGTRNIPDAIGIEVCGDELYLIATCGYTLGVHRWTLTGPDAVGPADRFAPGDFAITVPTAPVRSMLRLIGVRHTVALTITPDGLHLEHRRDKFSPHPDATYDVGPATREPLMDWRGLLLPRLAEASSGDSSPEGPDAPPLADADVPIWIDPRLLARFAGAPSGTRNPVRFHRRHRMLLVTCGDHFIGAIAPVLASHRCGDSASEWHARLARHRQSGLAAA